MGKLDNRIAIVTGSTRGQNQAAMPAFAAIKSTHVVIVDILQMLA